MIGFERTIAAPPANVWKIVSRLDEWHRLLPTVDEVSRVGPPGPIEVGSTFRLRQPGLPPAEYVVTDWQPSAGFTWESRGPGIRAVATHVLHPDEAGTRLHLGVEWSGPAAWLMRLLLTRKARRYIEQEAAAFAQLAEEGMR